MLSRVALVATRGANAFGADGVGRSFLSGSSMALLAKVANGVGLVLINALLARQLPVAEYGLFVLAYSVVILGGLCLSLGLGVGGPRLLGEAVASGNPARILGAYRAVTGVLLASCLGFGAVIALWGDRLLGVPGHSIWLGLWLALWVASSASRMVSANALRAIGHHVAGSLFDGPAATLSMLAILAGLAASGRASLEVALAVGALTSLASTLPCQWLLRRRLPIPPQQAMTDGPGSRAVLTMSLPMLVGSLVGQLSYQLPLWLLSRIGTAHELALYGAAIQFFNALILAFGVVAIGAMPVIIRLHARGERERLARFVRLAALVSALPIGVAVLALAWIGPDLAVLVFGADYRASGTIALWLCGGYFVQSLLGLNQTIATMTGSQVMCSVLLTGSAAMLLLSAWIGHSIAGVEGAAAAAGLMFVVQNASLALLVWRRLGFVPCAWWR